MEKELKTSKKYRERKKDTIHVYPNMYHRYRFTSDFESQKARSNAPTPFSNIEYVTLYSGVLTNDGLTNKKVVSLPKPSEIDKL